MKARVRIAPGIALGLAVLAALYAYGHWPDPVVETRMVSGVVTDWMRTERKLRGVSVIQISVSLDDGRKIVVTQWMPDAMRGPAEIEERHHTSGRKSYIWLRSKAD